MHLFTCGAINIYSHASWSCVMAVEDLTNVTVLYPIRFFRFVLFMVPWFVVVFFHKHANFVVLQLIFLHANDLIGQCLHPFMANNASGNQAHACAFGFTMTDI